MGANEDKNCILFFFHNELGIEGQCMSVYIFQK
jgi:hypothetical protein